MEDQKPMPFFNKLRKTQIKTEGLRRYLLYAIGEIVLVVLGILIALEINDWAQKRSERKQEKILLTNILSDLHEESVLLKELIDVEKNYFNEAMATFGQFAKNGSFTRMDSILAKMNSLYMRRTFNPVNATFREMTSSGSIKLIQNDSLKRAILKYYHYQERIALIVMNNNTRHVDGIFVGSIMDKTLIGEINKKGLPEETEDVMRNKMMDQVPSGHLKQVSESQLENPINALVLFNALKLRANVAAIHISQYNALEKKKQKLLTHLEIELKGLEN